VFLEETGGIMRTDHKKRIPHIRIPQRDRVRWIGLKELIVSEPERFFSIRDYFDPQGRVRLERLTNGQRFPGVCNIAWLHYERGLPKELVPIEVEWGGLGERLFAFSAKYTSDAHVLARVEHYLGARVSRVYGKMAQFVAGKYTDEERKAIETLLSNDRVRREVRFNDRNLASEFGHLHTEEEDPAVREALRRALAEESLPLDKDELRAIILSEDEEED